MRDKVLKELVELLESEVRANNSYYEKKLTDRKSLYMSLQIGIDEDIMTGISYERIFEFVGSVRMEMLFVIILVIIFLIS